MSSKEDVQLLRERVALERELLELQRAKRVEAGLQAVGNGIQAVGKGGKAARQTVLALGWKSFVLRVLIWGTLAFVLVDFLRHW